MTSKVNYGIAPLRQAAGVPVALGKGPLAAVSRRLGSRNVAV